MLFGENTELALHVPLDFAVDIPMGEKLADGEKVAMPFPLIVVALPAAVREMVGDHVALPLVADFAPNDSAECGVIVITEAAVDFPFAENEADGAHVANEESREAPCGESEE